MKHFVFLVVMSVCLLSGIQVSAAVQNRQVLPASSPIVSPSNAFTFYAIYDRLADDDSIGAHLTHAAMSADGEKLIFSAWNAETETPWLYTVDADGGNLTHIPLPNLDGRWIVELTMNADGSRAFFTAGKIPLGATTWLYKVENGAATKILQTTDHVDIDDVAQIQTTANGAYVYFLDNGHNDDDVWRIGHAGGTLTKIIEDTNVTNGGYPGAMVTEFAISSDASTIVFGLAGYWNSEFYAQSELFVTDAGGYRQLTTGSHWMQRHVSISGDGNTIVFGDADASQWIALRPDGSNRVTLGTLAYNFGGLGLTYDGSQMFYTDNLAHGGRLLSLDSQSRLDLFTNSPIYIGVTKDAHISNDGARVAFIYEYNTYPFKQALYIGHLNDPDAVPSAPTIHNITFTPSSMPRHIPDASIMLSSAISDQQGLADVEITSADEMLDGLLEGDLYKLPVYFRYGPHDDGADPDAIAGDGIFCTSGWPGGAIDSIDHMIVRVGAQDTSKTVVIADKVLHISEWSAYPNFLPRVTQ